MSYLGGTLIGIAIGLSFRPAPFAVILGFYCLGLAAVAA